MSTAWQCWSRSRKNVLATAFSWQWIDSFFASRNHTGKQLKTSFYLFPCTIERLKTTIQVLLLSCPVCFVLLLFRCNYLLHTARLFVLFGVFITRSMSGVSEKATKQKKRLPKRDRTVKSTWADAEKQNLLINVEHWEVIWNVELEDFKDEQIKCWFCNMSIRCRCS